LVKKIKNRLKPEIPYKNTQLLLKVAIFMLFFFLFTVTISSGLFGTKLNVELGEPSPELIVAPYDREIEDLTTYREEQQAAASMVEPVYAADESQIAFLAEDLAKTFLVLKNQQELYQETKNTGNQNTELAVSEILEKLRETTPFTVLADEILLELLHMPAEDIDKAEETINGIIIGLARNPDSGAKSQSEVIDLKNRMREQVEKSGLAKQMKTFAQTYIELKVVRPTLIIDEAETNKLREQASAQVKPSVYTYRANEKIVGPGEIVDEKIFQTLLAYGLVEIKSPWIPAAGIAITVLIAMVILIVFAYQISPDILVKFKRFALIGLLMFLVLALGKAFLSVNLGNSDLNNLTGILIPAAWATITVTILLGVRIAVVVCLILGIFVGIMADPTSLGPSGTLASLFAMVGGLVGIQGVARLDRRSDLARAGVYVAGVNLILVSAIALILELSLTSWLIGCILALANGFLASVLTMGTLPWLESGFNITSPIRLLELSNPNSPLLKALLLEAPGTYHHSVLVGNLAETAAEAVNADPVLVRVGSLYHDIGKLKRPYFFIENQFSKDNPHDKIAPTLSALIITSHTKDGLEMAKEHKLPEEIQDIIAQHHGDSLTTYFYHKALEENPDIPEEAFRYDGLRPQSKETALVLLADSVEAAVRSQKLSTPGRIEGLVRKIIKEKFDEGLLDHCDLTFKDLDKIGLAFVKVLSGIFHSRVEYPELPPTKKEEIEKNKETKNEPDQDEAAKTKGEVSTPCPDSCLEDDDQSGSDNDSKDDCCTKDNQLGDNKN
jgi:putative nucleotidyltransferase with HDIG domain